MCGESNGDDDELTELRKLEVICRRLQHESAQLRLTFNGPLLAQKNRLEQAMSDQLHVVLQLRRSADKLNCHQTPPQDVPTLE